MDWIKFTRQERIGIAWFILVTALVLVGPKIYKQFKSKGKSAINYKEYPIDTTTNHEEKYTIEENFESWEENGYKRKSFTKPNDQYNYNSEKFDFDPNTVSSDSLKLLGFSDKAINAIEKARSKGFHYYSAEDLKNTIGVNPEFIDKIATHIKPVKKPYGKSHENTFEKNLINQVRRIEINTADSLDFDQLPKIGVYTTHKILSYRRRLGGFIAKDQLLKDNIIPDSIYNLIESFLDVDVSKIQGININSATYKTMTKHPYFTSSIAIAIEKYRKQHGPFSQPNDIRKIIAIKKEEGLKILPYLSTANTEANH